MSGIKLPTETGVTERNQKSELQKLSGSKLDDAYLRDELQGHKEAISAFESEIENGQNQEVKNYAPGSAAEVCKTISGSERISPGSWGCPASPA